MLFYMFDYIGRYLGKGDSHFYHPPIYPFFCRRGFDKNYHFKSLTGS